MYFFIWIKEQILLLADLLKSESAPGIVVVVLFLSCLITLIPFLCVNVNRIQAIKKLQKIIQEHFNSDEQLHIDLLDNKINTTLSNSEGATLKKSWANYRHTFIVSEFSNQQKIESSTKSIVFFNAQKLNFLPGFYQAMPGLLVSVGLFCTFLGLVSALQAMSSENSNITNEALNTLLSVASAKFIMSLTGLFLSIFFTIFIKTFVSRINRHLTNLNYFLDKQINVLTLEKIALEQLIKTEENRTLFKEIATTLVAELSQPLKEGLPNAIAEAINNALTPSLQALSEKSEKDAGNMSKILTENLETALSRASQDIEKAGTNINSLTDKLNESSQLINEDARKNFEKLVNLLDNILVKISDNNQVTQTQFTDGVNSLLQSMNNSLDKIKSTSERSANDMKLAADKIIEALNTVHGNLETSAKSVGDKLENSVEKTTNETKTNILNLSALVAEQLSKIAENIKNETANISTSIQHNLLYEIQNIATALNATYKNVIESKDQFEKISSALENGANSTLNASKQFDNSANSLITAVSPINNNIESINRNINKLENSTENAVELIIRSTNASLKNAELMLESTKESISGNNQQIQLLLKNLSSVLDHFRNQTDKFDEIDEKLGHVFNRLSTEIESSLNTLSAHFSASDKKFSEALDTMQSVITQAEVYLPKQTRY